MSALLRPRKRARHAKPSKAAPILVAGGMTAAFALADSAAIATSAAAGGSAAQFDRLAQCESGGSWSINTGNGYFGGLQFNLGTWRGLGFAGYPHQASKATQVAAGQKLHSQRGWGPWPACSRKLGLSGDGGVASTAVASTATRRSASAPASRSRGAAVFDGQVMTTADVSRFSATTRAWQQQLRHRGWRITVDGYFGPQSASVAQRFAAEKGLRPAVAGTVDRAVFAAAWTAPVT